MQIESKLHSFKLEPDESFKLTSYGSLLSQRAKICNYYAMFTKIMRRQ